MLACSFCSYNVATLLVTHLKYPDPKLTPSQVEGNPTKPSFLLYLIWNFIPAFAFYVTYWTHCALGYHKSTHTSTWCWMWFPFFIHVTSFNFEEFRKAFFWVIFVLVQNCLATYLMHNVQYFIICIKCYMVSYEAMLSPLSMRCNNFWC